jgi:hypothetical protein
LVGNNAKPTTTDSRYEALRQKASKLAAGGNHARAELQSLRQRVDTVPKRQRQALKSQIAKLNSESAMMQTQLDTIGGILGFAAGTSDAGGLTSHIEALERSLPARVSSNTERPAVATSSQDRAPEPEGIWGILQQTLRFSSDLRTINGKIRQTDEVILSVEHLQIPLRDQLAVLMRRGDRIVSQTNSQDPAVAAQQKAPEPTVEQNNRWFHRLLIDGIPVDYRTPKGEIRGDRAKLFDAGHLPQTTF